MRMHVKFASLWFDSCSFKKNDRKNTITRPLRYAFFVGHTAVRVDVLQRESTRYYLTYTYRKTHHISRINNAESNLRTHIVHITIYKCTSRRSPSISYFAFLWI